MAQIVINEISKNYTFNIGTNSFATVALPITSCWGPGYFDPESEYEVIVTGSNGNTVAGSNGATVVGVGTGAPSSSDAKQKMLEHTVWQRFPATQEGLESFVSTYRGPSSCYRLAQDYSYQMAVTLLTAGYDVLVCRLCPGSHALAKLVQTNTSGNATINFRAKYPGTFGNSLQLVIRKVPYVDATEADTTKRNKISWNLVTYIVDASGVKTSVESKTLVFNVTNSTDAVPYYKEVESNFWEITEVTGRVDETIDTSDPSDIKPHIPQYDNHAWVRFGSDPNNGLTPGTDYDNSIELGTTAAVDEFVSDITDLADSRYKWAKYFSNSTDPGYGGDATTAISCYAEGVKKFIVNATDDLKRVLYYREWLFSNLVGNVTDEDIYGYKVGGVYDLLKDKLAYNPQRIISPGWDDQDLFIYEASLDDIFGVDSDPSDPSTPPYLYDPNTCTVPISPMHLKLMDVAYYGRCATGFIDTPKIVDRRFVHIESDNLSNVGYIQKLARVTTINVDLDANGTLFHTHSAFFAPWGQYSYVGTTKQNEASPSFLALMIQRAQILNQPIQYEWALPTDRKHNLRIGKMEYTVPKKVLDKWQKLEGASVNVITTIPDLGTNLWGNSTLFEVPPATYQALANLSTRYLVNAVEDVAYRCGIDITFQYNNSQAYNKFYAGVTPLLDTMKNVGAIEDYRVTMSADINGEDHVNANSVIGKIWLIVNGVINDIYVDLIALPAGLGIDLSSLT